MDGLGEVDIVMLRRLKSEEERSKPLFSIFGLCMY